jgi:hypothetical protein
MIFNKDKDEQGFLIYITKIAPEEFIALAKLLDVKLSVVNKETGEYAFRDAEDIINECVNVFRRMPHKARKAILKAMAKSKGVVDGASTKNSTNQ